MKLAKAIVHVVQLPPPNTVGNFTQHKRCLEAYTAWKFKNSTSIITLLSTMQNDLLCVFEEYECLFLWISLKDKFVGISAAKRRRFTITFDTYKKQSNTTMSIHLREIGNLIRELNPWEMFLWLLLLELWSRHVLEDGTPRRKGSNPQNKLHQTKND